MENFIAYNPTKLYFGKGVITHLPKEIKNTKNILFLFGKGSIKRNGIYNKVIGEIPKDVNVIEYSGIKPNPVIDDINNILDLTINTLPDIIIAVGGGSVIDSAKVASVCIKEKLDPWAVATGKVTPQSSIPLIAVLTIAATGTEMNPFAVIQNTEKKEKVGFGNPLMYPKASFLDPEFTLTVSEKYTMYGIVDIIAHCLESYFGYGKTELTDRFIFSILKETLEIGPKLLANPINYEYRERMMWAATCALNGMTLHGKKSGDWGVHDIGHVISVLFDTPHGATLSIAYPAWMKLMQKKAAKELKKLGLELFNTDKIEKTIIKFEEFFLSIKCPVRLNDVGITENKTNILLEQMIKNDVNGSNFIMDSDDYKQLIDFMK
ncbi:MAG: iron-containing alcohol dehydrogenase [Marinilabiliales bacterium]